MNEDYVPYKSQSDPTRDFYFFGFRDVVLWRSQRSRMDEKRKHLNDRFDRSGKKLPDFCAEVFEELAPHTSLFHIIRDGNHDVRERRLGPVELQQKMWKAIRNKKCGRGKQVGKGNRAKKETGKDKGLQPGIEIAKTAATSTADEVHMPLDVHASTTFDAADTTVTTRRGIRWR